MNFKAILCSSGTITKGSEKFQDELLVVINLFVNKLSFSIMKYSRALSENEIILYLKCELSNGIHFDVQFSDLTCE